MANDFAGLVVKPGENTDLVKVENDIPAPPKPEPPKPPAGWDKPTYQIARQARKKKD